MTIKQAEAITNITVAMDIPLGKNSLIRIQGKELEKKQYIDIRKFQIPKGGTEFIPTEKGIWIPIDSIMLVNDLILQAVETVRGIE